MIRRVLSGSVTLFCRNKLYICPDMMDKTWHKYLIFGLFCVAIYFPVFLHLDWQPVNNWDESLFAMRAAYMSEEGHYLRDYSLWVDGGMQHRSTKPPFTTWLQVLSFKKIGRASCRERV